MKHIFIIVLSLIAISCSGVKTIVSSSLSDSLDVSRKVTIAERVVYVPVLIDVPAQRVVEISQPSDTSVVETDFAKSTAYLRSDGLMYHDIVNKQQSIPVNVPVAVTDTTDVTTSKHSVADIREIPVRLPLTWWEQFWCRSGQIGWIGLVLIVVGVIVRVILKRRQ